MNQTPQQRAAARLLHMQNKRKAWLAAGLTTQGYQRTRQRHPDLAHLLPDKKRYHLAYVQKQRKKDREGWTESKESQP